MEKVDYVEEISTSVIFKDTLGFHHILQDLKKIDSFDGSLMLAKGFAASQTRRYEQFVWVRGRDCDRKYQAGLSGHLGS